MTSISIRIYLSENLSWPHSAPKIIHATFETWKRTPSHPKQYIQPKDKRFYLFRQAGLSRFRSFDFEIDGSEGMEPRTTQVFSEKDGRTVAGTYQIQHIYI